MEGNNTTDTNGFPPTPKEIPVIVLVVGIASILFNGALLFAMTFNSKQVFASLGSYFIYNLAIADFITGVNSIVWACSELLPPETFSVDVFKALLTVFWITVQVSFFTILVMSTERVIAIVYPFKAALIMSKKKTTVYCVLVWIISIICAGLMNMNHKVAQVQFGLTIVFELAIACIVVEYVQVFRQLRALWQKSKSRAVFKDKNNTKKTTDLQREYEVTVVVVTLAVILVVTVFPYMIATQIVLGNALFGEPLPFESLAEKFVMYYFPVELLNFVVNPVVYGWRLPKYRKAFLATFGFGKKRNLNRSNSSPKTTQTCCPDKEIMLLDKNDERNV